MEAETQGEEQDRASRMTRLAANVTFARDPLASQSAIPRCHPRSVEQKRFPVRALAPDQRGSGTRTHWQTEEE